MIATREGVDGERDGSRCDAPSLMRATLIRGKGASPTFCPSEPKPISDERGMDVDSVLAQFDVCGLCANSAGVSDALII